MDIVITGVGVISPIGVEKDQFWTALATGQSGVGPVTLFDFGDEKPPIGGQCPDFDIKAWLKKRKSTRKSLKVMSRDIQMGYVAALKACDDAAVDPENGQIDPDRFGVLYGADLIGVEIDELAATYQKCAEFDQDGAARMCYERWGTEAMANIYPLWMLKYLPNMPACHIAIGQDARGPNNSLTLDRVASLSAVTEAYRTIERGMADIMIAGAASSRLHPNVWGRAELFQLANADGDPTRASRPFDAERSGFVHGEGAAAFVIESLEHAERRGAKPIARLRGFAQRFQWNDHNRALSSRPIAQAIEGALQDAGMTADEIGHVNADGLSTVENDRIEAEAIRQVLGDVPVTAPKSYFGNASAASGALEMAASVLGLQEGLVPPTLNYTTPDAACPVNVVHGEPLETTRPTALVLNQCSMGRSVALILEKM